MIPKCNQKDLQYRRLVKLQGRLLILCKPSWQLLSGYYQPKPNEPSESAAQIAVQAAPGVCLSQAGGAVPAAKEDVILSPSQVVMGTVETGKRKTKALVQTCFKLFPYENGQAFNHYAPIAMAKILHHL
ncbi:UNVERIFIED_CONTAM: hypothetical protein FKN15_040158 [Acipenser sinensis]